jgi:hypothetical protein
MLGSFLIVKKALIWRIVAVLLLRETVVQGSDMAHV